MKLVGVLLFFMAIGAASAQPIPVSLPDTSSGVPGAVIAIPIVVGDLTGQNIISYQCTITFDETILTALSVSTDSTLSEGFTVFPNISAGQIILGAFSTSPLSGSGVLVNINFAVDTAAVAGQTSALVFQDFIFNAGNPPVSLQNGTFTVAGITGLNPRPGQYKPVHFMLHQNYPNPFNSETVIPFDVPAGANTHTRVRIVIYDSSGQLVRRLWDSTAAPGTHQVRWDGRDETGQPAASGVYMVNLVSGDIMFTQKMQLIK